MKIAFCGYSCENAYVKRFSSFHVLKKRRCFHISKQSIFIFSNNDHPTYIMRAIMQYKRNDKCRIINNLICEKYFSSLRTLNTHLIKKKHSELQFFSFVCARVDLFAEIYYFLLSAMMGANLSNDNAEYFNNQSKW